MSKLQSSLFYPSSLCDVALPQLVRRCSLLDDFAQMRLLPNSSVIAELLDPIARKPNRHPPAPNRNRRVKPISRDQCRHSATSHCHRLRLRGFRFGHPSTLDTLQLWTSSASSCSPRLSRRNFLLADAELFAQDKMMDDNQAAH